MYKWCKVWNFLYQLQELHTDLLGEEGVKRIERWKHHSAYRLNNNNGHLQT